MCLETARDLQIWTGPFQAMGGVCRGCQTRPLPPAPYPGRTHRDKYTQTVYMYMYMCMYKNVHDNSDTEKDNK